MHLSRAAGCLFRRRICGQVMEALGRLDDEGGPWISFRLEGEPEQIPSQAVDQKSFGLAVMGKLATTTRHQAEFVTFWPGSRHLIGK